MKYEKYSSQTSYIFVFLFFSIILEFNNHESEFPRPTDTQARIKPIHLSLTSPRPRSSLGRPLLAVAGVEGGGQVVGLGHRQRAGEVPADVGGRLALDGPQPGQGLVAAVEEAGATPRTVGDGQDAAGQEAGPDDVQEGLGLVVLGLARYEYLEREGKR